MHIVLINASYRGRKGVTAFLLGQLEKGIHTTQSTVETIVLTEKAITRCIACGQCQTYEHLGVCAFKNNDDVGDVFAAIANADIVVYGAPVYILGMPGLLKMLFERIYAYGNSKNLQIAESGLFFHQVPEVCRTPFATLMTCNNFEPRTIRNSEDFFEAWAQFHGAPCIGRLKLTSSRLFFDGNLVSEAHKARVFKAFVQAGRELGLYGRIARKTQRQANRETIPIPLFRIMKRFGFVKRRVLKAARQRIEEIDRTDPGAGHTQTRFPDTAGTC